MSVCINASEVMDSQADDALYISLTNNSHEGRIQHVALIDTNLSNNGLMVLAINALYVN